MVGIFFDQLIRNGTRIHYNIQEIDTGQGDDYAIGCLLDYSYFKKYYYNRSKSNTAN